MTRRLRKYFTDTFGFSKTEANGILILILLIIFTAVIPRIYLIKTERKTESFTEDPQKLSSWAKSFEKAFAEPETRAPKGIKEPKSFDFDPNTATESELIALGFSEHAVSNLIKYRKSGGSFQNVSDLGRIYGISMKRINELNNHIVFREPFDSDPESKPEKPKSPAINKNVEPVRFNINSCDTNTLQQINGIGPVLSKRIVKFRERLGGFFSLNQLYEVYGLDSATVSKLLEQSSIASSPEKTIPLNSDSIKFIYQHPYIDYQTARVIFNYRKQHGAFDSVNQIREIKIISDSLYQKIYPYLSIEL